MKVKNIFLISLFSFSVLAFSQTESNSGDITYTKNQQLRNQLREAIRNGKVKQAELLLKNSIDINATGETGETLLMEAVLTDNKAMVALLLKNGADPKQGCFCEGDGRGALIIAADANNFELAQMLIDAGADINESTSTGATALTLAREHKNQELVSLLEQKGAKEGNKHWKILEVLRDANLNNEADIKTFKAMIKGKEEANTNNGNGWTALFAVMEAPTEKKEELVDFLISKGADINFQDEYGKTLLINAITTSNDFGNLEGIKFLIAKGADPKIKDKNGKTILDYAIEWDKKEIVEFLKSIK